MRRRRRGALIVVAALVALSSGAQAEVPFPEGRPGDPYDYTTLHIEDGSCDGVPPGEPHPPGSDLPAGFDCRDSFKLSDYAAVPGDPDYDPLVAMNPQELFGRRGPGTNRAWEVTTGRPDVVLAVMDSGIRWDEQRENLVEKYFLNAGELPEPAGGAHAAHDADGDGVFNVTDFASDPRAVDDPDDDNDLLDPGDLIRAFSDGVDGDGNGYVDDISGWDFFEGDNDPNDDVDYGHGTGESEDSAGEIGLGIDPQCPNCMLLEMRVGDSFVADVNHFAEATVYATDNGASVIQSALGTLNNTAFATAAVEYAYDRGVLLVASAADEAAGHHNMPSALDHAMVVNSVTPAVDTIQQPATWLALNGCTNFGGYIWVAVASTSCSSDAVGQTAGMAGLVYSAAANAVDRGILEPTPSGRPISAEEARQLFRIAADDIDFSSPALPLGLPNNFLTTLPLSMRYVTTAGWDQITGWGRSNTDAMVRMVELGHVPPEAAITAPAWWAPLPATGTVDVSGRVAAPRAVRYTWEVQVAPGVQPPKWPARETWTTVADGAGAEPYEGRLATLDLTAVRRMIDSAVPPYSVLDDPTARALPEQHAFRIRVVVHADGETRMPWKTAIDQRQAFAHHDPTLLPGWPVDLGADGAGSPAFDDLDGDGLDELVIGDGSGRIHAYRADGSELPGWPVRTDALPLPTTGDNGFTRGELSADVGGAVLTGAPVVADLDGDGGAEVAATDLEGKLYVWLSDGERRAGFPARTLARFSEETACQVALGSDCDDDGPTDARDHLNTVDHGFTSQPVAADLDPATPGLELIAGANDGHVYAWHADGRPVSGWPVLLRDPARVAAVDPVTHRVTYADDADAHFGRKVIAAPAVGDVDGDGDVEVAVNVNEQYGGTPNSPDPALGLLSVVQEGGNTRTYLLHHDGTAHTASAAHEASPHPDDQAYVEGWPVPIAMATLELLPYVGEGSNGTPVLGDVDGSGDGRLEAVTASIASPPYVLRADGTSALGVDPSGRYNTAATTIPGVGSLATDFPTFAALGGGALGRMGGPGSGLSFGMGAAGLRRLLDVVLPEQQLLAEDHIGVWDPRTGRFEAGFPAAMNDLQFFGTPAFADVTGDGHAEVLAASATYDLAAYSTLGLPAPGFPKHTAGWSVSTPGLGDLDGDGRLELALATREGNLFVWRTDGDACQAVEWPKAAHDLRNTATYGVDADRPGPVGPVTVVADGADAVVRFAATGDDGRCGTATSYRVTTGGRTVDVPAGRAGVDAPGGAVEVRVVGVGAAIVDGATAQAVDDAGNAGPRSVVGRGGMPAAAGAGPGIGAASASAAAPTRLPATGADSSAPLGALLALAALVAATLRRRVAAPNLVRRAEARP